MQLVPYKPDVLDASILWTESKDLGAGFRTIRMVNNVNLVMDAFNGDKDHGGIHEGTVIALFRPWKGDNQNQQWKLYPHCKFLLLLLSIASYSIQNVVTLPRTTHNQLIIWLDFNKIHICNSCVTYYYPLFLT